MYRKKEAGRWAWRGGSVALAMVAMASLVPLVAGAAFV